MKKQEMANTSLKENRTHGTVQYPVALYEWNGENEWHVVPHWHEEMEWIYFQKGDIRFMHRHLCASIRKNCMH